ncbi:MAG: PEP-CTERM sorting domain-containing protein [Geminicoccaceae bacterium]
MSWLSRIAPVGAVLATLLAANTASAVTINSFQFIGVLEVAPGSGATPATISFAPDFTILAENGVGTGDLVGLEGDITGDYDFADPAGASTVALTSPTAPNSFLIDDGIDIFSADVDLFELQGGPAGSIFGSIDFSSSTYVGANAGLIALNTLIQSGTNVTVTFQTLGGLGVSLDDLFENGTSGISIYSAAVNLTSVPEPAPLAILGLGLLCSVAFARRRRSTLPTT